MQMINIQLYVIFRIMEEWVKSGFELIGRFLVWTPLGAQPGYRNPTTLILVILW